MYRCLAVQPSGYYAWQKDPLSQRAREDLLQTKLIRQAWNDSNKVYGYRKLHNDLMDQGETCCPNRVAGLTKMAGIKRKLATRGALGAMGASHRLPSITRWLGSSMSACLTKLG
jgi:putative transposase